MVIECRDCGCQDTRYRPSTWNDPCKRCGSVMLYVYHAGFDNVPPDRVLMNIETGEEFGREIAHHKTTVSTTWIRKD